MHGVRIRLVVPALAACILGSVVVVVDRSMAALPIAAAPAEAAVEQSLAVTPEHVAITLLPGQTGTANIHVTNNDTVVRAFSIAVEDFSMGGPGSGTLIFHGSADGPFPGRALMAVAPHDVTIGPGGQTTVVATITVPRSAVGGDRYGAVVIGRNPLSGQEGAFNAEPRVGVPVLITVEGAGVVRGGNAETFVGEGTMFWQLPVTLQLVYRNIGTVHREPSMELTITNLFGMTVETLPLKDWTVLRNAARERAVLWDPPFALGYYRASIAEAPGTVESAVPLVTSFWVIPLLPVSIFLFVVCGASFLWHVWRERGQKRRQVVKKRR